MSSLFSETFQEPQCFFGLCNDGAGLSINDGPYTQLHQNEAYLAPTAEDQKQKEELDALLSQAMNGLTFEERQQQQEVLHGVDEVVEDDASIDNALQNLDHHLSNKKQGSVYERAEQMDLEYVQSKPFRVMFLRANEYDPEASADQMLRFFDLKHELFGENKLTKDITLEDLDEDDIVCLRTGFIQMAGRDRSGRQIFIHIDGLMGNTQSKTIRKDKRVQYYMIMRALKSEETQIRGIVSIWYGKGDLKSKNTSTKGYLERFLSARALPQKKAAIHICVDEIRQVSLGGILIKVMKFNMRARLRVHTGSLMECQYQLSTYGIPPDTLTLNTDGRINSDTFQQWVHSCVMKESLPKGSTKESDTPIPDVKLSAVNLEKSICSAISPRPDDVLFAGGKMNKNLGNQRFLALVLDSEQAYNSGTDESKRHIASSIIDTIHESGGRFLKKIKRSAKDWEEVPSDELRTKVMQTFRNRRRRRGINVSKQKAEVYTSVVHKPLATDVVFGRAQRNPGTEVLHRLINDHFEEYESLDRGLKMRLVETIMRTLTDGGGRFLQPAVEADRWVELSHDDARDRISKYFRNHRRFSRSNSANVDLHSEKE